MFIEIVIASYPSHFAFMTLHCALPASLRVRLSVGRQTLDKIDCDTKRNWGWQVGGGWVMIMVVVVDSKLSLQPIEHGKTHGTWSVRRPISIQFYPSLSLSLSFCADCTWRPFRLVKSAVPALSPHLLPFETTPRLFSSIVRGQTTLEINRSVPSRTSRLVE